MVLVDRPSGASGFSLELENHPKLRDISLRDTHVTSVKLHNLPALGTESSLVIAAGTKKVDLEGVPQAMLPVLLEKFSPASVEELKVSGTNVTTLNVTKFSKLTKLSLKGTGLSEAELINTIGQLQAPSGQLEIEASRLTTGVQNALTAKGWTAKND